LFFTEGLVVSPWPTVDHNPPICASQVAVIIDVCYQAWPLDVIFTVCLGREVGWKATQVITWLWERVSLVQLPFCKLPPA
jgi:hypothetical protein